MRGPVIAPLRAHAWTDHVKRRTAYTGISQVKEDALDMRVSKRVASEHDWVFVPEVTETTVKSYAISLVTRILLVSED